MNPVQQGLHDVHERVNAAARRAGRDGRSVRVVAVSKRQPLDRVRDAIDAGQLDLGENFPQALRERVDALADHPGAAAVRWHAIGPLQTNKAALVARLATTFHALDRVEVAQALSRRREGAPLDVLIQVNVAGEASKHGVAPDGLPSLLDAVLELPQLRVTGLMTMPPWDTEGWRPDDNRRWFAGLRELAAHHHLRELSMGTTDDFEVAVEEGATLVRVGRSIFGERA